MTLLQEKDRQALKERFATLKDPVKLVVFTQEFECQYCRETRQLAEELAELSDKISLELYDFDKHAEIAEQYCIDKIPATAVVRTGDSPQDFGIRYYGIPSGYEFSSLLEEIILVSSGESGLNQATKAWIAGLDKPIHMQVFVTPTCPYCPQAVVLAHRMAMESPLITADMVEATEFPHLSQKYSVYGVPRTVINENVHMEGATPESMLLQKMREAVR